MVQVIIDDPHAGVRPLLYDLLCNGLRQEMGLDDIPAFPISDQAPLTGDNRSIQFKLTLETHAVLMTPPGGNNDLRPVFTQTSDGSCVFFADLLIRPQEGTVQINRG